MEEVGEQETVGDDVDEVDNEEYVSLVIFIREVQQSWQNSKEKEFISQCFEGHSVLDGRIGGYTKSILFHHVLLERDPGDDHEQGDEGQADPQDGGVNVDLVGYCNPSEVCLYGWMNNSCNKVHGGFQLLPHSVQLGNFSSV